MQYKSAGTRPDYKYVGYVHSRQGQGRILAKFHGASMKSVMWEVDQKYPPKAGGPSISIRIDRTSDGTYWGEGAGALVAAREGNKDWLVY